MLTGTDELFDADATPADATSTDVVVTGIGLISALGTIVSTWQGILAGHSGIQLRQPFQDLPPLPLAMIGKHAVPLEALTRQVVNDAIAAAQLTPPLLDCAVVIGSSRGQQYYWETLAREYWLTSRHSTHPQFPLSVPWLNTLPHAAARAAAEVIGTTTAVRSPMAACATGLWAIAQAYDLIHSGEHQRVIAGAVETPITPLTLTGFKQMGALAQTGAYPFDCHREGLVLGEGGAVFVLESAKLAHQRGAKIYGRICGVGLTADAHHVSAPNPDRNAAIAAVSQCLHRSHLQPDQIDFIHAHGTATQLNDQHEAELIQTLFPASVAISSTKGATGHTIGASGALGLAFCFLALRQQQLPPTVGLTHPAFDLNFVRTATSANIEHVLCLSFGFGGQNVAIALTR